MYEFFSQPAGQAPASFLPVGMVYNAAIARASRPSSALTKGGAAVTRRSPAERCRPRSSSAPPRSARQDRQAALERSLKEKEISIAIIATPAPAAQETAERLVAAGVRSILNFAPTVLTVPEKIHLRQVDLSVELQILAFYEQRAVVRRRARPDAAAKPDK